MASDIAATLDAEGRWRQLGELALSAGQLTLAAQCMERAKDFSGQLMMRRCVWVCEGGEAAEAAAFSLWG